VSVFLDTNILIYSVSSDSSERAKRDRARGLLDGDCVLSVQVLQEFYVQMTRSNRPGAISHQVALELIENWRRFPIQENTMSILVDALRITERYRFSLWDSLIIAAAIAAGCDRLMSEDMSHGQTIEGLAIVNPFVGE
jgi:predicted nucleic acid-binding protein